MQDDKAMGVYERLVNGDPDFLGRYRKEKRAWDAAKPAWRRWLGRPLWAVTDAMQCIAQKVDPSLPMRALPDLTLHIPDGLKPVQPAADTVFAALAQPFEPVIADPEMEKARLVGRQEVAGSGGR